MNSHDTHGLWKLVATWIATEHLTTEQRDESMSTLYENVILYQHFMLLHISLRVSSNAQEKYAIHSDSEWNHLL